VSGAVAGKVIVELFCFGLQGMFLEAICHAPNYSLDPIIVALREGLHGLPCSIVRVSLNCGTIIGYAAIEVAPEIWTGC
jgi:hypothetical protein